MTVKELIKELKKMPPNLRIGYSAHDNYDNEIADWISNVSLFSKKGFNDSHLSSDRDRDCFNDLPDKAVVLRS
jgi:hypothetical protein